MPRWRRIANPYWSLCQPASVDQTNNRPRLVTRSCAPASRNSVAYASKMPALSAAPALLIRAACSAGA
jgi:hypothetical protein